MSKHQILGLIASAAAGFGCVEGLLLLFRPDLFLRFTDWLNGGNYAFTGERRKDVYNLEYKFLGLMILLAGLFFLVLCVRVAIRR